MNKRRYYNDPLHWVDEFKDKTVFISNIGDSKNTVLYLVKNRGYKARGYELLVLRGRADFKVLGYYGIFKQAKEAAESWVLAGMPMNVCQEYKMGPVKSSYRSF